MGVLGHLLSSVLDDVPMTADERKPYVDHVLSDLLTYRVYDGQENLFHNDGTVGFLLEVPPVIGAEMFRTLQTAINKFDNLIISYTAILLEGVNEHHQRSKREVD